ncbi:MAG: VRR-NUC domain-containing protein [Desulfonauticus sp.]|nr:VRR-NUC domain-containing protein [Desulfonauticus sp.]
MTRKEDDFQIEIARLLDLKNVLWTHVANERKANVSYGRKLKRMGVKSGVPDILIFEPRKNYNGLAIELKVGYNKPTTNQIKWLDDLKKRNWLALWSNSTDEVIDVITNYLKD